MLDSFRAEFPSFSSALGRVRIPPISREPSGWAFLSALGAAFLFEAVFRSGLLVAPQWVLAPSRQWPFGATVHAMSTFAAHIFAGAVLMRAGGPRAVLLYVAYAATGALISLPGVLMFCERSGGQLGFRDGSCNVPLVYIAAGRAPEWLGVAIGVAASRWLPTREGGANRVLRGAGAYSVALFLLTLPLGFQTVALSTPDSVATGALLVVIAWGLAGVVGGIVLAAAPLAGAVLVALAILGPFVGSMTPLLRAGGASDEPLEFTLARWATVLASSLAAIAILVARGYVRRRRGGTFF